MVQTGLVGKVKRERNSELPEFESLRFRFRLGTSDRQRTAPVVKPNHVFIPLSPTQAKRFSQAMNETGSKKRVSKASGMIHHDDKHVSLFEFYPFGKGPTNHHAARNGIGTQVHRGIAEYLRRTQPTYTVAWEGYASHPLRRQLEKIGLKNGKKYPVQTYREIIMRHERKTRLNN